MRLSFYILLAAAALFWSFNHQSNSSIDEPELRYEFALSLINGPNTQVATFAVVAVRDTVIVKTHYLSKSQFINQITGAQRSIANPLDTNLMEVNGILDCYYYVDSISGKYLGDYCPIIDDLWKIRFKRNPFAANMRRDEGWAHNYYSPSQPQLNFLREKYKVKNISDFYIGENMFQLLRDIQDSSWIRQYQEVK